MAKSGSQQVSELEAYYAQLFGQRWHKHLRTALAQPTAQVGVRNLLVSPAERPRDAPLVKAAAGVELTRAAVGESIGFRGGFSGLSLVYNLDLASVLPAIALAPEADDRVLDACASPGGKALLLLLQMMHDPGIDSESHLPTGSLVVNEVNKRRLKRLKAVLSDYVPPDIKASYCKVTCADATKWHHTEPSAFDKVLVDVPCSSDRHVVQQRGDASKVLRSDWSPARLKRDASLQVGLLESALASTRPGGRVVYSTCSLSNTQNDAVVQKALRRKGGSVDLDAASSACALMPGVERTECGFIALPDETNHGPIFWTAIRMPAE